jgi:hypothetical protein
VYSDDKLGEKGFKGEGQDPKMRRSFPKTVAIKTHRADCAKVKANAAVFLLRNPFEAVLSKYHYRILNSHTAHIGNNSFMENGMIG